MQEAGWFPEETQLNGEVAREGPDPHGFSEALPYLASSGSCVAHDSQFLSRLQLFIYLFLKHYKYKGNVALGIRLEYSLTYMYALDCRLKTSEKLSFLLHKA